MNIQRFLVIGDMHRDMQNKSSTSTAGVDDRTGVPTVPELSQERFDLLLQNLKREKKQHGLDFVICNGDLVHSNHDDPMVPLAKVKKEIEDAAGVPMYAGYGNHDRATDAEWFRVFGHRRNHAFSTGDYGHIILQTSDETGGRQICIGEHFLQTKLAEFAGKKGVFVYAHIPRCKGSRPDTKYDSPGCVEIMRMLQEAPNLYGIFHSHFHEEDRMFKKQGVNLLFTGHFAHYGLNYYGYRIVEIQEGGQTVSFQYDATNKQIRYRNILKLE